MTKTKFEAMEILQRVRHPLRADPVDEGAGRGPVAARHRHRGRGRSSRRAASISRSAIRSSCRRARPTCKRSPLLGEHTDEILADVLGILAPTRSPRSRPSGATEPPAKKAAAE